MKILPTLALSLLILSSSIAYADYVIEDFQQYTVGEFPDAWRTWPFRRGKAKDVYKVKMENSNKFLSADDSSDISVQTLKNFYWKLDNYSKFSWKWRARKLPKGANETDRATNDSACGVYIIISKGRGKMLKYTWSTLTPVGTVYEKKPGKAFIIAKDSGGEHLGEWRTHTVNVRDDYEKYTGRQLDRNPVAIAVLTDGNAVHKPSACDYDDFIIKK